MFDEPLYEAGGDVFLYYSRDERDKIVETCADYGLPIMFDEFLMLPALQHHVLLIPQVPKDIYVLLQLTLKSSN